MSRHCFVVDCSNGDYRLERWRGETCQSHGTRHGSYPCDCDPPFQYVYCSYHEKVIILFYSQTFEINWRYTVRDDKKCFIKFRLHLSTIKLNSLSQQRYRLILHYEYRSAHCTSL